MCFIHLLLGKDSQFGSQKETQQLYTVYKRHFCDSWIKWFSGQWYSKQVKIKRGQITVIFNTKVEFNPKSINCDLEGGIFFDAKTHNLQ